jgi:hypothetical protein
LTCRVEGLGHKTIYGHYFFMIKTFRWLRSKENKLMQYDMAKQKRHVPWLWTETTETEKRICKGKNKGRFYCIRLEGQTRCIHADQHKPTTRRRKFLWQ